VVGTIVGWECSNSKETAFVERAIRQATAARSRAGNPVQGKTIHHFASNCQPLSLPSTPWHLQVA
jgi:putative transposase